jgi:Tfp pilus assembly protein PilX
MKISKQFKPRTREQGVVTLLVCLLLLTVATLASMAVGKSIYFEQKLTGNDMRSKEAYAAALNGLDYAMEYLGAGNTINWSPNDSAGATATITLPNSSHGQSNTGTDSYTHTLTATILTDLADSTVVNISSTSSGVADQHITRTVSQNVVMVGVLSSNGGQAPPIVVEGCMTGVGGNPNIFPQDGEPAISSLSCAPCGSDPCVDTGHFDSFDESGVELDPVVTTSLYTDDSLWDTLFSITKDQFRSLAAKYPARFAAVYDGYETTGFYSAKYNGNTWNDDTGTATAPVIIFFEKSEDCPQINGNVTIYGMIYYDKESCGTHGFGAGNVYGTVAVSGNMQSHTANTNLHYFPLGSDFGGGGSGAFNFVSVIPGSWKDF